MIDIYEMLGCTPETVTDNDIGDLKRYEEADSYPPRFKVQFSSDDSQSGNTHVKLSLHGLTNTFSRTIRLGKESPGIFVDVYHIITKEYYVLIESITF